MLWNQYMQGHPVYERSSKRCLLLIFSKNTVITNMSNSYLDNVEIIACTTIYENYSTLIVKL